MNKVQELVRDEKKAFMLKQVGKSIEELETELGISHKHEKTVIPTGFLTQRLVERLGLSLTCENSIIPVRISIALETKFIMELFDNPEFQNFIILRHFSNGYNETFGLVLEDVNGPCQHCGRAGELWYSLCICGGNAMFAYAHHANFEHVIDSPYEGCRLAEIKDLLNEYLS